MVWPWSSPACGISGTDSPGRAPNLIRREGVRHGFTPIDPASTPLNRPDLATDTDLCVKCGLCLPHCPTYAKTLDENESPRGRLALIQGVARNELKATPELVRHVDRCLLCRSCEAVCPAYVPYSRIVDGFRQETGKIGKGLAARLKTSVLRKALTGPLVSRLVETPAAISIRNFALESGIPGLLGLGETAAGLPKATPSAQWTGLFQATGGMEAGRATLFLGCTAKLLDAATVDSAIRVMNRLGITVRVPENQTCCGALHWHSGEREQATERMEQNLAAFEPEEGEAIVGFASGCGAMLRDYADILRSPEAKRFSGRIRDISQFLAEFSWPAGIEIRPLPAVVALHSPCSLRNVLRADSPVQGLLQRIPDLQIKSLPTQAACCGAAGSYMLEQPSMAGLLREEVLEQALAANPAYLATSNPGCAMHLRAGLKLRGRQDIEVLHPITLLARQIAD